MPLKTYEKINTVVLSLPFGRHWNWCNSQTLIFLFGVAVGISACCLTEEQKGHGPPVRQAHGYVPVTAGELGACSSAPLKQVLDSSELSIMYYTRTGNTLPSI